MTYKAIVIFINSGVYIYYEYTYRLHTKNTYFTQAIKMFRRGQSKFEVMYA